MSNIKKVETLLKETLLDVMDENGAFSEAKLKAIKESDDFDADELESTVSEIELTLADFYPETPYFGYLMTLITKIREVYGIDEENIDEDYLLSNDDFVLDFPEEEVTDEDRDFLENDDSCLDYLF